MQPNTRCQQEPSVYHDVVLLYFVGLGTILEAVKYHLIAPHLEWMMSGRFIVAKFVRRNGIYCMVNPQEEQHPTNETFTIEVKYYVLPCLWDVNDG